MQKMHVGADLSNQNCNNGDFWHNWVIFSFWFRSLDCDCLYFDSSVRILHWYGHSKQLGKPWVCLIVRFDHVSTLNHENHNRNCLFRSVIVPILWGHIPLCVVYLPWKYHDDCFIGLGDMTNLVCMSISLENRFYRQSW